LDNTILKYPGINAFLLQGKKIAITGASSGIGMSCALVCASLGAELLLIGRDKDRLYLVADHASDYGLAHYPVSVDLREAGAVKKVLENHVAKHGPLHGFIHSAGIEQTMPLTFLKKEQFDELFSVNFFSGIELAQAAAMKGAFDVSGASFVFISSILSVNAQRNALFYAASKGALNAAMRTLALELAPKKIRVNSVLPSVIETKLMRTLFEKLPEDALAKRRNEHPLGFGNPVDVAYACSYLLSDAARWITGTELIIDGGFHCK